MRSTHESLLSPAVVSFERQAFDQWNMLPCQVHGPRGGWTLARSRVLLLGFSAGCLFVAMPGIATRAKRTWLNRHLTFYTKPKGCILTENQIITVRFTLVWSFHFPFMLRCQGESDI
ncbi:hypothetical protein VFPPC_17569 [Pochonia chlamydosporia 170]|uniref:Transmembrane protein n=1 Tax=Pochonia chlamydosporia 170 TaxID=1380566 RepID=A0A219AR59_METCM|nr:hypothetical protein VFPPC_17569 [Pochonia chlamydosporia 170]OWT43268.1 hypothetical protein VFPPC_17569 [Pochonia chlamydosporia 170]